MAQFKPTVDYIKDLITRTETLYSPLHRLLERDEKFHELNFKDELQMPVKFEDMATALPTSRDFVDTQVDNTDLANARVTAGAKSIGAHSPEDKEFLEKFGQAILYMNNVFSDISPWRVVGKHFWLHGLGVLQTAYSTDLWLPQPRKGEGEQEGEYKDRMEQWRQERGDMPPILLRPVNPRNVMPDPSLFGKQYVIESHLRALLDVTRRWPKWSNPKGRKGGEGDERAEYKIYWDTRYRYEEVDGEPIFPGRTGIVAHNYGFLPYVFFESGLGNLSSDGDLAQRYVGILRYMFDVLLSQSRKYSMAEAILKLGAWPWGVLEGTNAQKVAKLEQEFGTYNPLPEGVTIKQMSPQVPPEALRQHLAIDEDILASHAGPRSLRGMGEQGVRSGADRRQILSQATSRFRYSNEAFKHGAARVLVNCARIYKYLVPDDAPFLVGGPSKKDTWLTIKREDLKEPFSFAVEFAPVSEEDEYRRHDDLERLVSSGIIPRSWARQQLPNVDAVALELEVEKQKLMEDPALQQVVSQYASGKLLQALIKRGEAETIAQGKPITQPTQPTPQTQPGRALVPPIPQRAAPGSAEEQQLFLQKLRSQMPMSPTQGQGGGGNRP